LSEIPNEEQLYRRIAPHQRNPDGSVNSSAFKQNNQYETRISVDRASLTTPEMSVGRAGKDGFVIASLRAGDARELGFSVEPDPLQDNPAHALITGENSKLLSRKLAALCTILPGVEHT
jgi:hypothetical protein